MRRPAFALPLVLLTALLGCERKPAAGAGPVAGELTARTVHFDALSPFLPAEVPGFERSGDEGSTGKYGDISVSQAERSFKDQLSHELSVRIIDTTLVERLGGKIRAAASDAKGRGDTDPTAPIVLQDAVGFVLYDQSEEKAEANLLVGDRFVVAVTAKPYRDTKLVRAVAQRLDLAGLSKLR